MKLHLLGTTGYHPNDRRETACYLLPELGVMLDAGTGIYRARKSLCTPHLDIFLTHAHLDHIIGLTYLFDVLYQSPVQTVTVHAVSEVLAAIQQHLLAPAMFPVPLPCQYQELDQPVELADGSVLSFFPLQHPGGSLGYRIDWPTFSLAYVTDTTASLKANYLRPIAQATTLLHECYFGDELAEFALKTGHSSTSNVAQVAVQAEVQRLVLVHLSPYSEELDAVGLTQARSIFPETLLAEDGMVLELDPALKSCTLKQ